MPRRNIRDTVLLSGWLFADLLLGLMIIFFVSMPGAVPRIIPIPKLTITPTNLDPTNAHCSGGISAPRCTVTIGETATSDGEVNWTLTNDMSTAVVFSPAKGTLSPGKSATVAISAIPCQNGSFTLSGSQGVTPVTVAWHCTPPPSTPERLDFSKKSFTLTVNDINGLLNDSPPAIDDIKQQVRSKTVLQGRSVGIAIVYGNTLDDAGIGRAQAISVKVYHILGMLGQEGFAFQRASFYVPLYTLNADPSVVEVDVYLFKL